MKDRSRLREKFLGTDLPTQLHSLAANLARIATSSEDTQKQEVIMHLLDESKLLIDWLAPTVELEQQFILADLQRCLVRWQFGWSAIVSDATQRLTMADQARQWSNQLWAISDLLTSEEPITDKMSPSTIVQQGGNSREEIIQQLVMAGLVRSPGSWDTPGARAWRERSEVERQRLVKEMQATYLSDSLASTLVNDNRR